MSESLTIDSAVVPTITFEFIYLFFVMSVDRRRILHFNVTKHPTEEWTAQQVVEACPFEAPGRFLFRDNDKIYGAYFKDRVAALGLTQVRTAYRSPWQNPFSERWIGGLRRDCLDHLIAVSEGQLRRVIGSYVSYFHDHRTHLGLEKDTPMQRREESPQLGKIVVFPRVGGLHRRYSREEQIAAQVRGWGFGQPQATA